MAANPYQYPQESDETLMREPRTSALAVCSLVFGILCCIPGSGLLGTIFGGAGLIRIAQSEGRLSGRVMAVIGLLLGLMSTAFWIAGAAGSMYMLNQGQAFVQPLKSLQSGDTAGARAALTPSASAKLTDEQAKAFFDQVKAEMGAYQRPPEGLAGWINDYQAVAPILDKTDIPANSWPIPVHFEKGMAVAIVHLDSAAGSSGRALVKNIEVRTASGKTIYLIEPSTPPVKAPHKPTPPPPPPAPAEAPKSGG